MKVYVACGLTHVPAEHFERYVGYIHALASALQASASVEQVRYALVDSDPQLETKPQNEQPALCYDWDRRMVEESDIVVADASFPSTGMGIELQLADNSDTPIILLIGDYANNRVPSRRYRNPDHSEHHLQVGAGIVTLMALGVPSIRRTIEYAEQSDAIRAAVEAVELYDQG
ncbi:hypothetical protein GCM10023264_10780 [Sphingomonas daechungensis]|uniref:Nucleoside 2-deoxyribosyltransferase n=1 Tax=Sphingomonas daechungensis TaxID=1176646 RepID=A0ABX6T3Z2_9SPHN|nr:hypothetical protein [Sphingomonas daechungensis]QNP44601.1 hypothetical protein H9L15_16095 [Sphingomonas daechungensis]